MSKPKTLKAKYVALITFVVTAAVIDIFVYSPVKEERDQLLQQNHQQCKDLLQVTSETKRDLVKEKKSGVLEDCKLITPIG